MENLIGTLRDAVALLMVIRIAVLLGVVLIVLRVGYSIINSSQLKQFFHHPKKGFLRHKNLIKPGQMH
jgi:hypothetical protein